jgi:very-short-patch-repair endonuclease
MRLNNLLATKEKRCFLRSNMTEAERMLWVSLKNDKLGVRFRRQFGIGYYIVDFYCPAKKLAIEADGGIHLNQKEYDVIRDAFMNDFEIRIVRFRNDQIKNNLSGVINAIIQALALDEVPPLPRGGGRGSARPGEFEK